jgi:LacI family transcriptional regulator
MLRSRLTNTIGIIAPELSQGYFTGVMLGVEQYLLQEGFLYFTVSHLGQPDLKDEYQELLMRHRVDGFLLVNTQLSLNIPMPVVGICSHSRDPSITNIMLDHNAASPS